MESISAFLGKHDLHDAASAMEQNLVETVEDLLFLAQSQQDCVALGLAPDVAHSVWQHLESMATDEPPKPNRNSLFSKKKAAKPPSSAAGVDPTTVELAGWLANFGSQECEPLLRAQLVETVDDLLFVCGGSEA